MFDVHTTALAVMTDQNQSPEVRNAAHITAELIMSNLLVLANGDAEARSTETCHVFAVWTPVSNAFTDLFDDTSGYKVARLTMHS